MAQVAEPSVSSSLLWNLDTFDTSFSCPTTHVCLPTTYTALSYESHIRGLLPSMARAEHSFPSCQGLTNDLCRLPTIQTVAATPMDSDLDTQLSIITFGPINSFYHFERHCYNIVTSPNSPCVSKPRPTSARPAATFTTALWSASG